MNSRKFYLPSEYKLFSYDEVDSTMITARNLISHGQNAGIIVWAKKQTQGRGRHGNKWVSPRGNLYFSFIRAAESKSKGLSFAPVYITSLSLAETIDEISSNAVKPFLKWPNDLLLKGSKLAGILVEKFATEEKGELLNIGVGVNINSSPGKIDYSTTNLKKENVIISPKIFLLCFFNRLVKNEKVFMEKGLSKILQKWEKYSHYRDDKLIVKLANKKLVGLYKGLDSDGALLLELSNGVTEKIYTGDVFTA